jgi:hypothetical protein
MSTETTFMAGVQFAAHILGKEGPIEVDYRNDKVEPNLTGEKLHVLIDACAERGLPYEDVRGISTRKAEEILSERVEAVGKLGRLYIGREDEKITVEDIVAFMQILVDRDYSAHYILVGVRFRHERGRRRDREA